MNKQLKLTYKTISYIFIGAIFGYFLISLSLMTELIRLSTYRAYLKPEVLTFYLDVDTFNVNIFNIATTLSAFAALMLAFKIQNKKVGVKLTVLLNAIALFAIFFFVKHYLESKLLLDTFNNLDLSWQSTDFTAEDFGFVAPSGFWLQVSTVWLLACCVATGLYLIIVNSCFIIFRKDVAKNEKTI